MEDLKNDDSKRVRSDYTRNLDPHEFFTGYNIRIVEYDDTVAF